MARAYLLTRLLVCAVLALLGWAAPAAAASAAPSLPTHSYSYDSLDDTTQLVYDAIERGPQSHLASAATFNAVDPWSHGASARPDGLPSGSTTTYTTPASRARVAWTTAATWEQARGVDRDLSSAAPVHVAANTASKLPWTSWQGYTKVTEAGREYAQIGDRLWSRHAVDRMQPGALGAPAGQIGAGRSISPNFVEDVIRTGTPSEVMVKGVPRTIYTSGSVQVVTEQGGRIVVTVNPFSGG